jgi:hypothetical protein
VGPIGNREHKQQAGRVANARRIEPRRPVTARSRRGGGMGAGTGQRRPQRLLQRANDVSVGHESAEPAAGAAFGAFDLVSPFDAVECGERGRWSSAELPQGRSANLDRRCRGGK